jgi:hypothetical protein
MKNSIEAHVEFSFKGEDYSLSSTIDLDKLLEHHDSLPSLIAILAKEHGIDTYSYLYEVMQEADIEFRNAQGIATDFLVHGVFDRTALETNWNDLRILSLLEPIASHTLGIADLNQHEALKNALIMAYNLGRESRST